MTPIVIAWLCTFFALAAALVSIFFIYGGQGDVIDLGAWKQELPIALGCSAAQAVVLGATFHVAGSIPSGVFIASGAITWLVYRFTHIGELEDREAILLGVVQLAWLYLGSIAYWRACGCVA